MQFQPVAPVHAYQHVVDQVEQAVFTGRLKPGERLPSERELMSQFGVSRSTVREALRVLQAGGMVRSRPGDPRGPEVLPASPGVLHKSMHRLARADTLSLAELLQFRMVVEGAAYELAANLRTSEQLAELDAAMAAMRAGAERGFAEYSRADLEFHEIVARATRNTLLVVCGEVVRGVVLDLIEETLSKADDRSALMAAWLEHHEQVLDAVRRQDGPLAARLARQALYDSYAGHVAEADRPMLWPLLDRAPEGDDSV
ncbi:FadR/GntR family transcriptional regulator [Amycolatopsis suaedae]|uniref:FadR family transcriptional regulator n=1 Tax=Amycolatopsis suaedae TaxID=2510978 RepID=A0A4Q7JCV3_9PSEU|nr:FadR/GntR family transcriptional regulator [Amycolatopsis suaedae]RZQ64958.1 FadR family transcriptional regulator [Amycolatopsis suaedae]